MKVTQDDLKTLYNRVEQYVLANDGIRIGHIRVNQNGDISIEYSSGYGDVDYDDIPLSALTADLDAIVLERKKREELQRIEAERLSQERNAARAVLDKRERYQKFLKLKEEFEKEEKQFRGKEGE